jgi:hypothetical protein
MRQLTCRSCGRPSSRPDRATDAARHRRRDDRVRRRIAVHKRSDIDVIHPDRAGCRANFTEVGWKERALPHTVSKIPETVRHERHGRVAGQGEWVRASPGVGIGI